MSEGRGSPQAWFKLAFADLRLAESQLHEAEQAHNVMWHCQQAVEKAIKGFLIARGERFRFTHDLTELSEPEIVDALIGKDREALAMLATRAIECRYPGDYEALDPADVATAVAVTKRCVQVLFTAM
jgi:HEPN domain-containing protein